MLMVPAIAILVPLFVLVSNLGLTNTYASLILPYLAAPIGVFLMRQYFLGLPDELIERRASMAQASFASSGTSCCRCAGQRSRHWRS